MKRRELLLGGLLALMPVPVLASLNGSTEPRDVSGRIVEVRKREAIVVLEDYQGWDREQLKRATVFEKSAVKRWLEGIDPKHAVIYLKAADVENLRKGDRIRIPDYHYASYSSGNGRSVDFLPLYEKVAVVAK